MHNVDHGAPRVEEQDGIKAGDVDAFGQAASVGQDAALIFGQWGFEPLQPMVAFRCVVGSFDVFDVAAQQRVVGLVVSADDGELAGQFLGGLDVAQKCGPRTGRLGALLDERSATTANACAHLDR